MRTVSKGDAARQNKAKEISKFFEDGSDEDSMASFHRKGSPDTGDLTALVEQSLRGKSIKSTRSTKSTGQVRKAPR